jgi:hypothetical protein
MVLEIKLYLKEIYQEILMKVCIIIKQKIKMEYEVRQVPV